MTTALQERLRARGLEEDFLRAERHAAAALGTSLDPSINRTIILDSGGACRQR